MGCYEQKSLQIPTLANFSGAAVCNPDLSFELLGVKAISCSWDELLAGRAEDEIPNPQARYSEGINGSSLIYVSWKYVSRFLYSVALEPSNFSEAKISSYCNRWKQWGAVLCSCLNTIQITIFFKAHNKNRKPPSATFLCSWSFLIPYYAFIFHVQPAERTRSIILADKTSPLPPPSSVLSIRGKSNNLKMRCVSTSRSFFNEKSILLITKKPSPPKILFSRSCNYSSFAPDSNPRANELIDNITSMEGKGLGTARRPALWIEAFVRPQPR